MGQLLGGLTNPGTQLQQPNGQTSVGTPDQVLGEADKALQAKTQASQVSNLSGSPDAMTTGKGQLPSIGQPSFQQAATSGAMPGSGNAMSPGLNKAGKLATLLMSGLQGAMAGHAANEQATIQSGGRRSGGAGMGFEAGYQLPWQRAGMQENLAQEQAKTGQMQAQTKMMQSSVPITLGNGQQMFVPQSVLPQFLRGGYGAEVGAASKEKVAGMTDATKIATTNSTNQTKLATTGATNQNRLDVEGLKFAIQNGQVSRVTDGIDPSTGQPAKLAYNRMGQPMGVLPGSLPSKNYLPSSTDTIEYKDDADGNIIALPKHSTRTPGIPVGGGNPLSPTGPARPPGASGGQSPGSPRVVAQAKVPGMVTGTSLDGRQVAGTPQELRASGALGVTKLEGADASKVSIARQLTSPGGLFDLANKDLAQFKPGELEALSPRWNEFLAGKVGTADPRYVALRTHVNGLLSTAMMQAHMGARGGEHIMEHFQNLADAGKMSQETLKAALDAERQYVEDKAMRPGPAQTATPQGGGGGIPSFKNWKASQANAASSRP